MIRGLVTIAVICGIMLLTMAAVELIWRDDEKRNY